MTWTGKRYKKDVLFLPAHAVRSPSLSSPRFPIYQMGLVTRAVQTGIGLAAELKAARKERKASEISRDNGEDVVQ